MYRILLIFFTLQLCCCENGSFDQDKRQIAAKNEVKSLLPPASRSFDITGFTEDTIPAEKDNNFKNLIRYHLDFIYKDSVGVVQHGTGQVLFTPDGRSIIRSNIISLDR